MEAFIGTLTTLCYLERDDRFLMLENRDFLKSCIEKLGKKERDFIST